MSDAARSIVVICEGPADLRTACTLADRVLSQRVDWMQPEMLDHFRQWRGLRKSEPYLAWKKVHTLADEARIRVNGHFGGEPGAPDAFIARRALALLIVKGEPDIDAVLMLRDSDTDLQRRKGLEQARIHTPGISPIVIGFAHSERECWVLAGFKAMNDEERSQLDDLRRDLGFDPCLHAEKLDATSPGAKREAKQVLSRLTQDDYPREALCWTETPLDELEQRGAHTGLAEFIREVRERLVPVWTGHAPTA